MSKADNVLWRKHVVPNVLVLSSLMAGMFLYFILLSYIRSTYCVDGYWLLGVGSSILVGCVGYAILYGAYNSIKAGVINVGYVLTIVGISLEVILIAGAALALIEAYQYDVWIRQFGTMDVASSGTDIRYWVAIVMLAGSIIGNSATAIILHQN